MGLLSMRELVQYISRFQPSYPGTVRPAPPGEIARLASLAGRPLPRSYRDFLETMGRSIGDFEPFDEQKDFSIQTVIDFYEAGKNLPPADYLFIAYDNGSVGLDLFLDQTDPKRESPVVEFASDTPFDPAGCSPIFSSLPNMLLSLAFFRIRLPLFASRTTLFVLETIDWKARSAISRLEAFVILAERMEFELVPPTGAWSPCYDRGDAGIMCYQAPGYPPNFSLGATDEQELDRLAEILCDNLGLVRRD
ncbi:MAG: SMI1/KNR4 family protein [Isosphaeraceae bacterium]